MHRKASGRLRAPLLAAFFLVAAHGAALAQIDGKVVGRVRDRDTGRPLPETSIIVAGTTLGNVADEDGHYFLNRVPVGIQTIEASLLGYAPRQKTLRVRAGHTSIVDFDLATSPIEAEGIVAVVETEPLLVRDRTGSQTHYTSEDAVQLPVDTVEELIALTAGVYRGQDGFIIRGGRGSESATYVDGVLTTDFTTQRDLTHINTFGVEEIDVVTGGFSAEYGYAQSGLINIVTRTGNTRELQGNVRFTTDGRFGTDGFTLDEALALEREPCCGYNSLQAAVGGPVIPGRLTAFGSLEVTGAADLIPRAAGHNPMEGQQNSSGSTSGILPGNRGDRTRLQFKSTAFLPYAGTIDGTLLYSRDQQQSHNSLYGVNQHLSTASRTSSWDAILNVDRPILRAADRDMTLRLRAHVHHSVSHSGVPWSPEAAAVLERSLGSACGRECEVTKRSFDSDFLNYRFGDIRFFFEDSLPGSVPNLVLPRSLGPDPVFGLMGIYRDDGFSPFSTHAEEDRSTLRMDLDTQLNRLNRLKVGTEWTWIELYRQEGSLKTDFGADLYDVSPLVGAAYVQHRWDGGDLVVDLGLRWDYWNPQTTFPAILGVVPCEMAAFRFRCTPGAETVEGRSVSALAPRLGIAHPLTDRSQIRLSFGRFHQLPELQHYFKSYRLDSDQFRGVLYGNPFLGFIRTTALELGLTSQITNGTAVDIVGYVRDRKDAIRAEWFQPGTFMPGSPEMRIFLNRDNGNVKGADLTLTHRRGYLSADLTWSLQWARGTTSSPLEWVEGFGALHDPLQPGRLLLPPNNLSPDSYDRLHNIDGRVLFHLPQGYRSGTLMGDVMENVRVGISYTAQSGTPYTRTDLQNRFASGPPNGSRNPWIHDGDVRIVKGLMLGQGVGLDLFLLVNNVLNHANVLRVHATTGIVDLEGHELLHSRNPAVPRSLLQPGAIPLFPINISDILPEYREGVSRQDLDGNGVITLTEAQEVLYRALLAGSDSAFAYGSPRQVRFGVELRF